MRYTAPDKLENIPNTPGVYAFFEGRKVLYIGKAGRLRSRVSSHMKRSSWKDTLVVDKATRVGWEETGSEIQALLLEAKRIKEKLPPYNVSWKDDKNYLYVAATKEEYPRVFLTHQPTRDMRTVGPFVEAKPVRRALRLLRRVFPYYTGRRDTTRATQAVQLGLEPLPGTTSGEYKTSVRRLFAALRGKRASLVRTLQKEMNEASKKHEYEKAARARDQLADLEFLFSHARVLSPGTERSPLDWKATEKTLRRVARAGKEVVRAEAYDISNIQGKRATGSMVVFTQGRPVSSEYRKFRIRTGDTPNDTAMMRETLERRFSHKEWPFPQLVLVDGGKPQLSSALKAVPEGLAVAAIAKRNNELFLPGEPGPVALKTLPQGVSNFILHMRDEAHRFAIQYHRKLRSVDAKSKTR